MTNLATNLTTTAANHPEQDALRVNGQGVTYAQLHGMAAKMAGALRANGIQPGDRVAIILPNVPAFPVVYWGILLAGGIVVPMNPLLKAGEIDYFFTDSGAKIAFVWPDFVAEATKGAANSGTRIIECGPMGPAEGGLEGGDPIAEPHERADDDTAIILYTSGTTGRPKGAELTHRNIHLNATRSATTIQEVTSDDVVMGCLPLFHVFGLVVGLNAATIAGASLALIPRFDPAAAIEVIEKERVTIMQGVPTMYAAILNHPQSDGMDASSLRVCASGGSAMPLEVMRSFEDKFGCIILEGYGLSETSPVASFNMPDRERKPGTIGVAIPGCEMRCVDLDGNEVPRRRGRRDRDPRRQRHEGLLGQARGDRRGHPRRLVPHRRPRDDGRRGLLHDRRPQEGHDPARRHERVPARGRGGHLHPPRRRRGRRRRRARRPDGRAGRRGGRPARGRHGDTTRTSSTSPRSGSPPTSTPARCGWCPSCPRARPARSCAARCTPRTRSERLTGLPDVVGLRRLAGPARAPRRPLAHRRVRAARRCGRRCSSSPSRSGCGWRSCPDADTADRGLVRLAGAPIVLVALGLLWWAWWSVRALRRGRREGWTLLLVLGGVSVVQAVLTPGPCSPRRPDRQHGRGRHRATSRGRRRPAGRHRAGAGLRRRRRAGPPQLGGGRRRRAVDATGRLDPDDGVSDPG